MSSVGRPCEVALVACHLTVGHRETSPCSAVRAQPLTSSSFSATEIARREDEGEVAERLREVADLPAARDIVLLGQQAEIVAQADEPLEQRLRFRDASVTCERVDQPERAGQELTLVARQSVVGLAGRIARDEAVAAGSREIASMVLLTRSSVPAGSRRLGC